ncbi:MAG TPA: hypothetical protein VG755_16690 [Nannocystaceae bacterium]|nr:hypothetical protein [Nannocystaceae bacterium]
MTTFIATVLSSPSWAHRHCDATARNDPSQSEISQLGDRLRILMSGWPAGQGPPWHSFAMNKIVSTLVDVALRIGRWLVRRLSARGALWLQHYMEGKVEDFERRLARARTERRKRWLKGRISRWNRAIAWLKANAKKVTDTVIDAVDRELTDRGIAMVAPEERLVAA